MTSNKAPRDRRDAFYMGASRNAHTKPPETLTAADWRLLGQWGAMALVGFVCVACGFVAGYRANDKPARTIIKPEKVWRFVERCPDNPYKAPDPRRFAPQTIPRTNPGAVDLLHAPDYAEHKHGRGRNYQKKGYSRGRPRNSQGGTSVGGVTSR